jgi:hypothetical protein
MVTHVYNPSTWEAKARRQRVWGQRVCSLGYIARPCLKTKKARHQWLTSIILANQEAEIRRITVQSQSEKIVHETLSQEKKKSQKSANGVAQGVGPEFKSQYHKKKVPQNRNSSLSWGDQQAWNQGVSRVMQPPKALGKKTSLPFLAPGGSQCSLFYGNVTQSLPPSKHGLLILSVSSSPHLRTPGIQFRVLPESRIISLWNP